MVGGQWGGKLEGGGVEQKGHEHGQVWWFLGGGSIRALHGNGKNKIKIKKIK